MSIESEVNPANKDCHNNLTSSISTPGTLTSSTNSKLGILHKKYN